VRDAGREQRAPEWALARGGAEDGGAMRELLETSTVDASAEIGQPEPFAGRCWRWSYKQRMHAPPSHCSCSSILERYDVRLMLKCFRNVYLNCLDLTACQLISCRIFDCESPNRFFAHVNRVAYVQQNVTALFFISSFL
jgi:hypothetical protein